MLERECYYMVRIRSNGMLFGAPHVGSIANAPAAE